MIFRLLSAWYFSFHTKGWSLYVPQLAHCVIIKGAVGLIQGRRLQIPPFNLHLMNFWATRSNASQVAMGPLYALDSQWNKRCGPNRTAIISILGSRSHPSVGRVYHALVPVSGLTQEILPAWQVGIFICGLKKIKK